MKKKAITAVILGVVAFFISSCSSISTKTYSLSSPLIREQSSIKIVLVADLHNTIFGKKQIILINKVKEENPDLIILCGDMFNDFGSIENTKLFLSGISGAAPIYYVTGNHEYYSGRIQVFREELLSRGIIILSDNYVNISINKNEIIVAGIEDPHKKLYEMPEYNQNEKMEEAYRELDDIQLYKILIAHRPERIEIYKKYSFHLILSGHTHGGQVRLPFNNGLIVPNQGLFPKYGGGLYQHENVTHIISRGLCVDWVPRINNPPELVVIIIESEENE